MLAGYRRLALACVVLLTLVMPILGHANASVPQAQTPRRMALVGGMLLDGNEAPPINHAAVLIEGNRIVKVGRTQYSQNFDIGSSPSGHPAALSPTKGANSRGPFEQLSMPTFVSLSTCK